MFKWLWRVGAICLMGVAVAAVAAHEDVSEYDDYTSSKRKTLAGDAPSGRASLRPYTASALVNPAIFTNRHLTFAFTKEVLCYLLSYTSHNPFLTLHSMSG